MTGEEGCSIVIWGSEKGGHSNWLKSEPNVCSLMRHQHTHTHVCLLHTLSHSSPQGDYHRHLAKVSYAMERKRAMLDALLRRASLHLVLLLAGLQELRQLGAVSGGLQQTAHLLEGHIAAVDARLQR